jgi:prepilin-type N-terminal cleavage/methylation domain-containing protein
MRKQQGMTFIELMVVLVVVGVMLQVSITGLINLNKHSNLQSDYNTTIIALKEYQQSTLGKVGDRVYATVDRLHTDSTDLATLDSASVNLLDGLYIQFEDNIIMPGSATQLKVSNGAGSYTITLSPTGLITSEYAE